MDRFELMLKLTHRY